MIPTDRFIGALKRRPPSTSPWISRGCYGRIVRTRLDHPAQLAEEKDRRLVMVMGPAALASLAGKDHYEMVVQIGHTREYIAYKLSQGYKYHLAVFTRPQGEMKLATWRNTLALVAQAYPSIGELLRKTRKELMATPFEEFEKQAGFSFAEIDRAGPSDKRYISLQRLLSGNGSALDVRLFLYLVVRLTELYSGDGYTRTHDGRRGVREYIMFNCEIDKLQNSRLLELSVAPPPQS